nr:tigger transposable element-derived protein 1-like isoform X2 [Nomia melanderi]
MFNKRSITQRKRKSISLDMKMKILNQLEEGEKPSAIAKAYGINESTVRTVKKRKENIKSSVASGTLTSSQCSSYTRNPVIENMEKALMIWMEDNIQKKIPMSSIMIREKAMHIFNRLREEASPIDKVDNFSASKGWYQKFKKRYSLRNLLNEGDINDLLVDRALTDTDLIHMISETQPNGECDSNYEETDSFTADNLYKALQLATKLETAIVDIDPNIQRASKFQQDLKKCCSEYQQIYENLTKVKFENKSSEKIKIETEVDLPNISSDENEEYVPIKKIRLKKNIDTE